MAIVETAEANPMNTTRWGDRSPRTRIREFRKLRGMTLKQLAEKLDTTPQTTQRLEVGNMTVSTAWLEKIARALQVEPMDLLGTRSTREIQLIGSADKTGRISRSEPAAFVHMEALADDPVAVRLDTAIGQFEAGLVLIANRFRDEDVENAHGLDCIVAVADGPVLLRRVVRGRVAGKWTLIPHGNGDEVQYDRSLAWAARIVMALRYY